MSEEERKRKIGENIEIGLFKTVGKAVVEDIKGTYISEDGNIYISTADGEYYAAPKENAEKMKAILIPVVEGAIREGTVEEEKKMWRKMLRFLRKKIEYVM